jgi:zinc protease
MRWPWPVRRRLLHGWTAHSLKDHPGESGLTSQTKTACPVEPFHVTGPGKARSLRGFAMVVRLVLQSCCIFAALLVFATVRLAAAPWAEVASDLPPDPALRLGTLPNGVRYALLPNAEPRDRVSLRLVVSVGSLHERDDERGLAHFVEHMAFRGTRSRPRGAIMAALERMGVGFGPDTAAFTSHDYTIYHLDLPDASETSLKEGLRVFREYASGIEFAPEDIERERGVILSEMATRDTAQARAGLKYFEFLWPESRHNQRAPIGLAEQLRTFKRDQFIAFYDAWYRPDRLALIAVGAIDPEKLLAMIEDEFGALAARAPAREEPPTNEALAAPAKSLEVFTDPGLSGITINFARAWLKAPEASTVATRKQQLHQSLACYMVQQRLAKHAQKPGATIGMPAVSVNQPFPNIHAASFALPGNLLSWEYVLKEAEQEFRRATLHGFTQSELAEAKNAFATSLEQSVRSAPTRRSEALASQLASTLLFGGGFCTPEAISRDLEPALETVTAAECLAAWREVWGGEQATPRVFVMANDAFLAKPAQVERALLASRETPVAAQPEAELVTFAYTDFGKPGEAERVFRLTDLDAVCVKFANDTRLNIKATTFEKNSVLVNVRVGLGLLSQPAERPGLAWLANTAFLAGGVGRHTIEELTTLLRQRGIIVHFGVESDAFNLHARCTPKDLLLACQLLTAYLSDAAYRVESRPRAHAVIANTFTEAATSPASALDAVLERALTGDRRFGWFDRDEPMSRTLGELRDWLQPELALGDLEASIVGDTTAEDAANAFAATLGALPKRRPRPPTAELSSLSLAETDGKSASVHRVPVDDSLKLGGVVWTWTVPDLASIHHERCCRLLAALLTSRARARLRDEMGASYDVRADFVAHDGFPNFNYFTIRAEVDEERVSQAAEALARDVADLLNQGATDDEFTRAKQPFIREYEQSTRTNAYWSHTVFRDAQANPARLRAARDRATDLAAITRAEINVLARRYLDPRRGHVFITYPQPVAAYPPPLKKKPAAVAP